jgi:hypothetical protein
MSASDIKDQAAAVTAAAGARELAARAQDLAAAIRTYHRTLQAAGWEPVRRAGFQCDTAAGYARQAGAELLDTAARLDRVAAAAAPGTCEVGWGACPVHGATLADSGGRSWCRASGCGREWDYDRDGLPCTEPARWLVTDAAGDSGAMCDGHAKDARRRLDGARITPLGGGGGR